MDWCPSPKRNEIFPNLMQHMEMFFESLLLDSTPCLLGLFVSVGSTLVWLLSYTVHLIPQLTNGVTVW